MPSPKILVLGNYRQTITIIRSLGKAGYRLVVGRNHENRRVFTQYSRYTAEIWPHPSIEEAPSDFVESLVRFLNERRDIDFVFPVGEGEILCLMRHCDLQSLPSGLTVVMNEPELFETCLDKFRLYKIVAQLGIPHAAHRKAMNYTELISMAEALGYPCVIKPNDSLKAFFDKKALIVESAADLRRQIPTWPEGNEFLVLQKFVRGCRHNCDFIADEGRILAYFEQRVLRTDRRDGTGYGVDTVSCAPTAQLRKYCDALIQGLNYSGLGCAQFLVNGEDGSANFLELNPRMDAMNALPFYCGHDFPRMAVEYAAHRSGRTPSPPPSAYPTGKRATWLWGDLNGWLRALKTKDLNLWQSLIWLGQSALLPFSGDMDQTWSWGDPLPGAYMFVDLASRTLRHFAHRLAAFVRR